jgi:hypothetical protein
MDMDNISGPDGTTQNVGGLTGRFRFSPIATMTTIRTKTELSAGTATAPDELIEIQGGNHAWGVGEGYWEGYCTRDEGELDAKGPQVRDAAGMEIVMKVKFPGLDANNQGVMVIANNSKILGWAETSDHQWIQLGSQAFPAELQYDFTAGKNVGKRRETSVTISAFDTTLALYSGTFTAHP